MYFGSDNQTGAAPNILQTIIEANNGVSAGYGEDEWCQRAIEKLEEVFECDLEAYFVATGTAANSLGLSCMVQPWESILCHGHSHIINDESTAPELFTGGARIVPISNYDEKLTPAHIVTHFEQAAYHAPHSSEAKALSITQVTENGLVYRPDEVKALTETARKYGMRTHMDGARFANAVASLKCSPADITWKAGIDVLSLGATKCGALCAEAVIFFDKTLAQSFIHRRKRSAHLVSKGRLFGAQFVGWLEDSYWLTLAQKANEMAKKLSSALESNPLTQVVWPVEANELFVIMPRTLMEYLISQQVSFYEWPAASLPQGMPLNADQTLIRLVTSFQSNEKDVQEFCRLINVYAKNS